MFSLLKNTEQPADIFLGMCPTRSSSLNSHLPLLSTSSDKWNSCPLFTCKTHVLSHTHIMKFNCQNLIRQYSVNSKLPILTNLTDVETASHAGH